MLPLMALLPTSCQQELGHALQTGGAVAHEVLCGCINQFTKDQASAPPFDTCRFSERDDVTAFFAWEGCQSWAASAHDPSPPPPDTPPPLQAPLPLCPMSQVVPLMRTLDTECQQAMGKAISTGVAQGIARGSIPAAWLLGCWHGRRCLATAGCSCVTDLTSCRLH